LEVWNSVYKRLKAKGMSDKDAETGAFKQANGVVKKENNTMESPREFRRFGEVRAIDDQKRVLEGYAAVFNQRSVPLGSFSEEIKPGAFARCLSEKQDVRALINHDPSQVIGRTKSGTLTLKEDERGLHFRCEMPDTQYARDLYESIRRGDIDGASFGFIAQKQAWREEKDGDGKMQAVRELEDVDLSDISPVTYPAYPQTSLSARSQLFPDGIPVEVRALVPEVDMFDVSDPRCLATDL
jgi:uncharacterized protein